jgi:hypothetical protein
MTLRISVDRTQARRASPAATRSSFKQRQHAGQRLGVEKSLTFSLTPFGRSIAMRPAACCARIGGDGDGETNDAASSGKHAWSNISSMVARAEGAKVAGGC